MDKNDDKLHSYTSELINWAAYVQAKEPFRLTYLEVREDIREAENRFREIVHNLRSLRKHYAENDWVKFQHACKLLNTAEETLCVLESYSHRQEANLYQLAQSATTSVAN
jgi:hypothetical protein